MANKKVLKRWIITLMSVFVAMTATPLAFLGNKVEPLIWGLPYFFWWCMFWPTMVFFTLIAYILVEDYGLMSSETDA